MNENDYKNIAAQLRNPSGEEGIQTAEKMFQNNGNMINRAIDLLTVKDGETVLELGYGNGAHLDYLFLQAERLKYIGVDISETMQSEARKRNHTRIENGITEFLLSDGINLPLEKEIADKIFTVNTIYFWHDHAAVIAELLRVMRAGGKVCLALSSRNFMEKLPFVKYGFQVFHPQEVESMLEKAGFINIETVLETEFVSNMAGEKIERELIFSLAQKPTR